MNQFTTFREEYSFGSVKRLVEGAKSELDEKFGVSEAELSEAESSILDDLSWDDLERQSEHNEWATFVYDDTIVKVYVYASYDASGEELEYTTVRFVLRESEHTCQFRVLTNGLIEAE